MAEQNDWRAAPRIEYANIRKWWKADVDRRCEGLMIVNPAEEDMSVYQWAMRHASMILFVVSAVIFVIGFGQALLALKNAGGEINVSGESIGAGLASFLLLLTGTFTALASAAIPFIGAVAIHRWDSRDVQ